MLDYDDLHRLREVIVKQCPAVTYNRSAAFWIKMIYEACAVCVRWAEPFKGITDCFNAPARPANSVISLGEALWKRLPPSLAGSSRPQTGQ